MANTFEFTGTLIRPKETEKFKTYEESDKKKDFQSRKLKFNVKTDVNRALCEIFGGYSKKDMVVNTFKKNNVEGEKDEQVKIPWKKRMDKEIVDQTPEYKKFVIVLGEETRMEFISAFDFAENMKSILDMEEYKEKTFKVTGQINRKNYNGKIYTTYAPQRVYLVDDEEEKTSIGTTEFHFGEGAVEDMYEEAQKLFIAGYTREYDSATKKQVGVRMDIEVDLSNVNEKLKEKVYNKYLEMFSCKDEEFQKIGLKTVIVKGIAKVEFDVEKLDEETKELIELGMMSIEEIKKEMGVGFGNNVEAIKVSGLAKGYSKGSQPAGLFLADYVLQDEDLIDDEEPPKGDVVEDEEEDEDLDLDLDLDLDIEFDDDDIDL